MNHKLLDEEPLFLLPSLAKDVGLNEAIFLQRLHWVLGRNSAVVQDGSRWIKVELSEWQEHFPFWSEATIRRIVKDLKDVGLILVKRSNVGNSYALNYVNLSARTDQVDRSEPLNVSAPSDQLDRSPCKRAVGEKEERTPPPASAGDVGELAGTLFAPEQAPVELDPSDEDAKVQDVWTYYLSLFGDKLRIKDLTTARRSMIRKGLIAVNWDADALKQAFDGLKSYRASHPNGSQDVTLDVVFKTRPGGSNLTDQIEFWAGQAKAKSHAGLDVLPPVLRQRVSERKQQVIAMVRMPTNSSARERGEEAAAWLAEHAHIKAHVHDDGRIEWVAA